MSTGLILAAPASGSGKTVLTLGLLRTLRDAGIPVAAAKSGPDYIDPQFHLAACGSASVNLDAWAMPGETLRAMAAQAIGKTLLVEGAMGLFDGAPPDGKGSSADLAATLGLPVVLVVDASRQGQSVAAVVQGFAGHRKDVDVAGVILNKVGSARHETMLRSSLAAFRVLGAVPRDASLALPSRHLGLVQANELAGLDLFLTAAARVVGQHVDLPALLRIARHLPETAPVPVVLPPIGQRIAMAQDRAFSFVYPHILQSWIMAGASLHPFSPLADETPDPSADAIFLPGGYPELHAATIAAAARFASAMRAAAVRGVPVYGECGGFMVLGDGLVDGDGARHAMLGLLRLETSFAAGKLHLGYRRLKALAGPFKGEFNGHEFHYSTTLRAEGRPLFAAQNAEGDDLGTAGLCLGAVAGSFAHLIAKSARP